MGNDQYYDRQDDRYRKDYEEPDKNYKEPASSIGTRKQKETSPVVKAEPVDELEKDENNSPEKEDQALAEAYSLVDNILTKKYLLELENYDVVPLDEELAQQNINETARFFKIDRIIFDKEENNQEKLLNVYNALYNCGGSVILLLRSDGKKIDFYVGTKSDKKNIVTCQEVLKKAMVGNFPGTVVEQITSDKSVHAFVNEMFTDELEGMKKSISAVTSVAGFREGHTMKSGDFVQGLEKLIETARGEKFSLLILSKPVSPIDIELIRAGYETLYSQLRPHAELELNYNQNESKAVTDAVTKGLAEGLTKSVTLTKSHSHTHGTSSSHSVTDGKSETKGKSFNIGGSGTQGSSSSKTLSAAVEAGFNFIVKGTATVGGALTKTLSQAISGMLNIGGTDSTTKSRSETSSHGTNDADTQTDGRSTTEGKTVTNSTSTTKSETFTHGQGIGYTHHYENRSIKSLLDRINTQLQRLEECNDLGMWECTAYVIADNDQTGQLVAGNYKALIRGKNSGVENSAITMWSVGDQEKKKTVAAYISKMEHPLLRATENSPVIVTPSAMISSEELTVAAGLPQHSLPGLPVDHIARFGREIVYHRQPSARAIELGKIYHMGRVDDINVNLDAEALTAHTFVTGSTGAGKSTAVYKILDELHHMNIPWLVIEPAKGEYKDAFGGENYVEVYGTNPYKVPNLLQINPFSFPDDVHVLEHVDRLVEIFNACWPMYAAMPAIMREAIERSYEQCGWSLKLSKNPGQFPTFDTLLKILPTVVDSSAYSADTSNDYKGALVTRVRSLTRGIHGMIFGGDIDMKKLLGTSSIIDLSRIGSQETKSLIMGVLVLKLQEFRMSEETAANRELRHVTVLEEAHNLLRRTSSEQSQESSNVQGQAVAMLANAIAEMRTYGEGFIIADQSPALMDMSVVRNTNTKIILRLPDEGDRQLTGKAAGLNEVQIEELAGLDRGVAAVFQSDWVEPVLCKVDKIEGLKSFAARFANKKFDWKDTEIEAVKKFLMRALEVGAVELTAEEVEALRNWARKIDCQTVVDDVLNGKRLSISRKMLLIDDVLDQLMLHNPRRDEAIEAAKCLLKSRFNAVEGEGLIENVTTLLLENMPERFNINGGDNVR